MLVDKQHDTNMAKVWRASRAAHRPSASWGSYGAKVTYHVLIA